MDAVTAVAGRPAVAYPNLGERCDSATHTWSGDAEFDTAFAADWVAAGARLVGCSGIVGPAQIAVLASVLKG